MKNFLKSLVGFLFLAAPSLVSAQVPTAIQWGSVKTVSPWNVGVFDNANIFQTVFTVAPTGGAMTLSPNVTTALGLTGVSALSVGSTTTGFNIGSGTTFSSGLTYPGAIVTGSFTATGLVTNADLVHTGWTLNTVPMVLGGGPYTITASPPVVGDLTEATSSILTITGGTGAVIGTGTSLQVKQSGTSQSGYLSSTDWNTFNGKQAAGSYITALTGDATASGPGSVALTFATVNSNVGSFGSTSAIPNFTVNAKGLVTAAGTNTIAAPLSGITGLGTNVETALGNTLNGSGGLVGVGATVSGDLGGTLLSPTVSNLSHVANGSLGVAGLGGLSTNQIYANLGSGVVATADPLLVSSGTSSGVTVDTFQPNSGNTNTQQQTISNVLALTDAIGGCGFCSNASANISGFQGYLAYTDSAAIPPSLLAAGAAEQTAGFYGLGENDWTAGGAILPSAYGGYLEGRAAWNDVFTTALETDCQSTTPSLTDSRIPDPVNYFGAGSGTVCMGVWAFPGGTKTPIQSADSTTALTVLGQPDIANTVTITVASPGVLTTAATVAPVNGQSVILSTSGALPTGLSAATKYYVVGSAYPSGQTFELATTQNGDNVTINIGTGVFTLVSGGSAPANGDSVVLSTHGFLPTGVTAGTGYFVVSSSGSTFKVSATSGGSAISLSGSQFGVQSAKWDSPPIVTTGTQSGTQTVTVHGSQWKAGLNFAVGGLRLNSTTNLYDAIMLPHDYAIDAFNDAGSLRVSLYGDGTTWFDTGNLNLGTGSTLAFAALTGTNFAVYGDGGNTFVNAQTNLRFSIANVSMADITASGTSIGAGSAITSSGPGGVLGNPAFVASSVSKTCGVTIVVTNGVVTSC